MVAAVNGQRFVLLGLASGAPAWTSTIVRRLEGLGRASEFIACEDAADLFNRLGTGRPFSALLVDHRAVGLDRELISRAADRGCPVVVVGGSPAVARWRSLGASAVISDDLPAEHLAELLQRHARPIRPTDRLSLGVAPPAGPQRGWSGRMVAVTGPGGTGASRLARSLAAGLSRDPRMRGSVLLVDACLEADQAHLHGLDEDDNGPDLQAATQAHRGGDPERPALERLLTRPAGRPYRLLPGLRRRRDWPAIGGPSLRATLVNLRRHHLVTVVDVEPLVDLTPPGQAVGPATPGEPCRIVMSLADLVLVAGRPGERGARSTERVLANLADAGVPRDRLLPVVLTEHSGSRRRARRAARLLEHSDASDTGRALVVSDPDDGDAGLATLLATEVLSTLDLLPAREDDGGVVPVAVGSLGSTGP